MKYACIRDHEAEFHVRAMCRVLEVSAAGYYAWRHRTPTARATANGKLLKQIEAAHTASRGTYGCREFIGICGVAASKSTTSASHG